MRDDKYHHFNSYVFNLKLSLLIAFCVLLTSCGQPDSGQNVTVQNSIPVSETAVNINTASSEELEKLPHVGKETAKKIIEYREKYGKFRRTENLILVHGMSDKKFRDLQNLVRVE